MGRCNSTELSALSVARFVSGEAAADDWLKQKGLKTGIRQPEHLWCARKTHEASSRFCSLAYHGSVNHTRRQTATQAPACRNPIPVIILARLAVDLIPMERPVLLLCDTVRWAYQVAGILVYVQS
ncbi:hypothetical protein KCP78_18215 [Salmonella enterica subsp. enterica]|nr:hypothetical protein KCP78_18215 [Salmonella enterica subsp. enterica]